MRRSSALSHQNRLPSLLWPAGLHGFLLYRSKVLGVKAEASRWSSHWRVSIRSFTIFCASQLTVSKVSSSTKRFPTRACRCDLTDLIIRSHTPPAWLALGGETCYSIPLALIRSLILSWYQVCNACSTLASAPLKFVPLSLNLSPGGPRLLTNGHTAWMKESVERSWDISICIDLMARQLKMNPFDFQGTNLIYISR